MSPKPFRLLDLPMLTLRSVLARDIDLIPLSLCSSKMFRLIEQHRFQVEKFAIRHTDVKHTVIFEVNDRLYEWFFETDELAESSESSERSGNAAFWTWNIDGKQWKISRHATEANRTVCKCPNKFDASETFKHHLLRLFPNAIIPKYHLSPLGFRDCPESTDFMDYFNEHIAGNNKIVQIVLGDADDSTRNLSNCHDAIFAPEVLRFVIENTPLHAELDVIGYTQSMIFRTNPSLKIAQNTVFISTKAGWLDKNTLFYNIEAQNIVFDCRNRIFHVEECREFIRKWLRFEISESIRNLMISQSDLVLPKPPGNFWHGFDVLPFTQEHLDWIDRHEEVHGFTLFKTHNIMRSDGKLMTIELRPVRFQIMIWFFDDS